MVLLGICTPVHEDSHCTAAELVYGTTLCLPCQFFSASSSHTDPTSYVHSASSLLGSSFMLHLSVLIIALFTFPTASPHVHMSLSDMMPPASLLNIRDGRYKVLKRRPKHCTLDIHSHSTTVSLDCLKPAHLEPLQSSASATPPSNIQPTPVPSTAFPASSPRVTHFGRHLHWPDRFHY